MTNPILKLHLENIKLLKVGSKLTSIAFLGNILSHVKATTPFISAVAHQLPNIAAVKHVAEKAIDPLVFVFITALRHRNTAVKLQIKTEQFKQSTKTWGALAEHVTSLDFPCNGSLFPKGLGKSHMTSV